MTVRNFIAKHVRAGSPLAHVAGELASELDGRLNGREERQRPSHIPSQADAINDLFGTDEEVWLIFMDAGRYDLFDMMCGEFYDGDLSRVYNGGVGYTGDWSVRHLTGDFGERGLFSWVPLRGFADAEYDGREHFAVAPDIQHEFGGGQDATVGDRLEALGYGGHATGDSSPSVGLSPKAVNRAVRHYKGDLNGGVIRHLKPHPPFAGLDDVTGGRTKTSKTWGAIRKGDLTFDRLVDAYIDTYRIAFEHAADLVPDLDGRVVITSDHGTCLGDCGQLFHGRRLDKHDHLTIVPWFEVGEVVR